MYERWKSDNWWVSPHNFADEVWKNRTPPQEVTIHEITLREGEETTGVVFTKEGKIRIARALTETGLKRIEVATFYPFAYSMSTFEVAEAIMKLGLDIHMFVNCAPEEKFINLAAEAGAYGVSIAPWTCDVLMKELSEKDRTSTIATSVEAVKLAKRRGLYVAFMLGDTGRTDIKFLVQLVEATVNDGGADSIVITDSFGICSPLAIAYLVRKIKSVVGVPVELHCHNDFGLAQANALAGYMAGAEVIHSSINGLGARCGNTATEEITLSLLALYGVGLKIKYENLYRLCKVVEEEARLPVSPLKPIAGKLACTYEHGFGVKKLSGTKNLKAFFPYLPQTVGREFFITLGKLSDRQAIELKLEKIGKKATAQQIEEILNEVRRMSVTKRGPVDDIEFKGIVDRL